MPRKASKVRVERGLYRAGTTYYACATPLGGRQAEWKTLGDVGLAEARRLRDEWVVELRRLPAKSNARMTFGEVTEAWLAEHETRVVVDDPAPRTFGALPRRPRATRPVGLRLPAGPLDHCRRPPALAPRPPPPRLRHVDDPRHLDAAAPQRGLGRAARLAGLEDVTFHVLRHTFASILMSQGHDPAFVSRQLGHANPAITLRSYAHLFDAARHAETARQRLEAEYRDILRHRPEPGRQLGLP